MGRWILAGLALATALPAPGQERRAAAGRVLGVDGRPISGATVRFLHRPVPASLAVLPEDRILVRTDDKGLFRAGLLPGRPYSSWASWDDGATALVEGIAAGDFVTLDQDPWAVKEKVRLRGTAAWEHRGPLQYRVLVGSENLDLLPVRAVDGQLELPPLPPLRYRTIEVLDRDGRILWASVLDRTGPVPVLAIPEPAKAEVVVRDRETGKGLPGVEIRHHIRNYWYTESPAVAFADRFRCLWPLVGRTDGDGRLTVEVAAEDSSRGAELHLLASKPGWQSTLSGYRSGRPYRDGQVVVETGPEIAFRLPRRTPPAGRVRLGQEALAETVLVPTLRVHVREGSGGAMGLPFVLPPVVLQRSEFALPAAPPGDAVLEHAWLVLPEAQRRAIAAQFGVEVPPAMTLPYPGDLLTSGGRQQLDPGDLRVVQVLDPQGGPAHRVVLLASPLAGPDRRPDPMQGFLARTDRSGRALLRLHPHADLHLLAWSDRGAAVGVLARDADRRDRTLRLVPLQVVRGRVVDGQGRPQPGALVRLQVEPVPDDSGPWFASELSYLVGSIGRQRCDRSGGFELRLLPDATDEWVVQVERPDRPWPAAAEVRIDGRQPLPDRVELVLGKK